MTNTNTTTKAKKATTKATSTLAGRKPITLAVQRKWITVAMGCWIPVLSLLLSAAGGRLIRAEGATAVFLGSVAFCLTSCVLAVSLSHLADAIGDITRSPRWASWLLAVGFDAALIFGELVHALTPEIEGLGWIVGAIMAGVVIFSMGLNCWAFLRCAHEPASKSQPANG